jgi:PHD/YefM family antitoxin component YafN of YafNO toxin-antitoxin module
MINIETINITSTKAQNNFGETIDTAIRQPVAITRRKRKVLYMFTPEALEDMIDGVLAMQAQKEGFLTIDETDDFLNSIRNA